MTCRLALVPCLLIAVAAARPFAQGQPPAPRPFPRAGQPAASAPAKPVPDAPAIPPQAATPGGEPSEAMLGLPVYPSAQFITSYDAGKGQRFYLFGTTASFAEVVAYYRSVLKQKGELVFEEPATHMFEVGRFREDSVGFPPGITVKDYTWGNMAGYANPKPGGQPARFPTVVQIVPMPAGTTDSRK